MADKNLKNSKNVHGKYYVDSACINCGQCISTAGDFFTEDAEGTVYVKAQPNSPDDVALCEQALAGCPVAAIGNDGE